MAAQGVEPKIERKPRATSMRWKRLASDAPEKTARDGRFVLENARGEIVRVFNWEAPTIVVVHRHDNGRIETVANLNDLESQDVTFDILAETSASEVKKSPVKIGRRGQIRFSESEEFAPEYVLAPERRLETKRAIGWSAAFQLALFVIFTIGGYLAGERVKPQPEVTVTMLPPETIQKMLQQDTPLERETRLEQRVREARERVVARKVVVMPTETKIKRNAPVPTRSTSFKKTAKLKNTPRAGGYKGPGPRGYGTNEPNMNSIGALGALSKNKSGRGNGGQGGLNLQAVGTEPGSGAGGKGFGGFGGRSGGSPGGRGLGGIGKGSGSGLSNAMYGKGLIAAPFGDGSPAPGSGGYGTRGKARGGEQGAGYGSQTIVGSWKGTGMHGNGPAGSGSGSGIDGGSLYGSADGDEEDAIVQGGLDRDAINEVIMRNLGQITYCYEQGLQVKPSLSGRVAVRFQIGPRGKVTLANVAHSSVRSAQVESCIVSKLKTWMFPKPHGGVTVAVTYPFTLRRVSQK